ncbi:MAG: hypothetical protein H6719_37655 [Sandaracinaceae bacterium]|nr:hypothetical protein [Sandaracinaceae bacterium]
MKLVTLSLASLMIFGCLAGCGTEAAPAPAPEPVEEEEPEPLPPPEPPPPPLVECPEDTWAVGSRGANTAAADGAAAANLVRDAMRGSFERVSVCRRVDGTNLQMICGPAPGGAECAIGLPGRRCSATLPAPVVPVSAGQLVDTSGPPDAPEWHCTNVR